MGRRYASSTKNTEADITVAIVSDDTKFNGADVKMLYTDAVGGSPTAGSISARLKTLYDDWLNGGRLDLLIDAIKLRTDKLAGEATTNSTATKNWNTVNDSPDSDGGLVVTLGTAATKKKLHSLLLDVSALTNGAAITVKLFQKINDNADVCVYDEDFVINTDPDGLWIVNGTLAIHDQLKVVVKSDTSESVAVEYTAVLEAM